MLGNVSHLSFIQEPRGQNKARIKGDRIQEGYSGLRELLTHQQKEFEMKRAEIREREEKRKKTYAERQERERRYSEQLRNGTLEERERERVYREELKTNVTLHGKIVNKVKARTRHGSYTLARF